MDGRFSVHWWNSNAFALLVFHFKPILYTFCLALADLVSRTVPKANVSYVSMSKEDAANARSFRSQWRRCNETNRATLLRFALSHRLNLNYLQFYGRRNVIIMRAKDHVAVGSRGWCRSYLPPDLHPPAGHSFALSLSRPASPSFSLALPTPYTCSISLFLFLFPPTTLLRTDGALAVSISSEAPSSSTDHLTHK